MMKKLMFWNLLLMSIVCFCLLMNLTPSIDKKFQDLHSKSFKVVENWIQPNVQQPFRQNVMNSDQLLQFIGRLPINSEVNCDYFNNLKNWAKKDEAFIKVNQSQWETFPYEKCSLLKSQGFLMPVTQEELDHPIAYSVVIYKSVHQFTRLLRAIYRPHNIYCIHVDRKARPHDFYKVSLLTSCLENVYLAPTRIDVQWGRYSVLEADLICMRSLWNQKVMWKSFINLSGQEFPLKTNRELVSILNVMNGANDARIGIAISTDLGTGIL